MNTKVDGTGTSLKAGDEYDGKDGILLYAMSVPKDNIINKEPGSSLIKIIVLLTTIITFAVITINNHKHKSNNN